LQVAGYPSVSVKGEKVMYKHIMVPLDGSTLAEAVLPFVELLAKAGSAKVTFVTVGEPPLGDMPPGQQGYRDQTEYAVGPPAESAHPQHTAYLDQMVERIIAYGKVYLNHIARRMQSKGVETAVEVLLGRPADQIVDYAQEHGVDLVAMSTHGRGGLARWRYGSVANELRHRLQQPFLLVRSTAESSQASVAAREPLFLQVVVPLDGSPLAEQALPHAKELAAHLGLEIHLVRVVSQPMPAYMGPDAVEYYYDLDADLVRTAINYLQSIESRLTQEGIRVTSRIFHGYAADNIVDYAKGLGQNLICMTTHGRTGLGRVFLGSVADKVLQEAVTSVLMVRAKEE